MPTYVGTGGGTWEIDIPDPDTYARELFDAQIASGELVEVKQTAKKIAPKE